MIPSEAKLVFKGVIFDVYQWEQKMYDGSTATFEMLKRPDTAEIVVVKGDKIVIQRQEQPNKPNAFLCLPGGRIEHGEDPFDGAKRELLEETGLESSDWQQHGAHKLSEKIEWIDYVFIARDCKKVAEQSLDGGEKIELIEVSFDELLALVDRGELHHFSPPLRIELVRAKYDRASYDAMKKLLFG